MHRRKFLITTAGVSIPLIAGCSGSEGDSGDGGGGDGGSNDDTAEDGDSGSNEDGSGGGDGDGSEDGGSEDEMSDGDGGSDSEESQDITQRGAGEDVLENAGLVIQEHEFVEDDYSGAVEGIVENTTDEVKDYVQVDVRAYDADGNQLDSYMGNTQDLQAGGTWAFEVPILDYEEMDDYDIAVTDDPLS